MEGALSSHWCKACVLPCWTIRVPAPCPSCHSDTPALYYKGVSCSLLSVDTSETDIKERNHFSGSFKAIAVYFLLVPIQTPCDCFKGLTITGCCWLESGLLFSFFLGDTQSI